ncbi:hypothetical protein GUJ93_ZPchr0006g44837 [Zizania palustris]|uniref:Uncharacterized protein n=1 Tax=Zizania palustris TaxID=103762 RepID=A0A8J5W255_ZIZPA|nr:hypothetical protein GUJ93_ZPchr0006g44837 [Zizania palustris]
MHASVVGRRRGFEPCGEVSQAVMNEFTLMNDHTMLLQGRDKSRISAGTETSIFDADEYVSIRNVSGIPTSEGNTVQDERQNKGKDLFYCDWSELGSLDDFETNLRNFDSTFERGSNYLEDPLWSSVCLLDAQHVPSSCHFDSTNLSTVSNESTTKPIISSVLVSDTSTEPLFLDQINMANADVFCPFDNVTSAELIGSCEGLEAIFCSNQEMLVPTASSITSNDEIVSSSTFSAPNLVAAYVPPHSMKKTHDPLNGTPDMILDEIAGNPLEMYFPPITAYEQPTNATSTQTHQFPEDFGWNDVLKSADLQFFSKGRSSTDLCVNPYSPLILEAVPVKDLGFQKLQEGMNQVYYE